ncbi:DUF202 domain-containing protein [Microbacterium sp. NPDC058062]|uniref:DUF202 domain-containing protein n=1 Tax=Microbacterium sp. NPDC058062 TaxID=3346320 RepID=UPI0036DBBB32
MSGPWDAGLQPERTELAWRRTALSIAVISLVAIRLLPAELGSWLWAAPGIVGVIVSAALWRAAKSRQRATVEALRRGAGHELPDAWLLLMLAGVTTLVGVGGVLLLITW